MTHDVSPWTSMYSPDRLIPSFIGMEIWREKSDEQIYNWPKWFLFCLCINGQLLDSAIHGWINHRIWISAVATYTQQHGTSSSVPPKRFRRTQIWIWCLFTIYKRQTRTTTWITRTQSVQFTMWWMNNAIAYSPPLTFEWQLSMKCQNGTHSIRNAVEYGVLLVSSNRMKRETMSIPNIQPTRTPAQTQTNRRMFGLCLSVGERGRRNEWYELLNRNQIEHTRTPLHQIRSTYTYTRTQTRAHMSVSCSIYSQRKCIAFACVCVCECDAYNGRRNIVIAWETTSKEVREQDSERAHTHQHRATASQTWICRYESHMNAMSIALVCIRIWIVCSLSIAV